MGLVALVSGRSGGVTTTALALARVWPEPGKVLVAELDPDGGSIAAATAANPEPGLESLAAAGRHYLGVNMVPEYLQRLAGGPPVLLAPPSPDRCSVALRALNQVGLPGALRQIHGFDVIADCGRIDNNSPALPVVQAADVVVFVARPDLVDIVALRSRLETLDLPDGCRAGVIVVDQGRHAVGDVAAAVSLPILGRIEWDPRAAQATMQGLKLLRPSKLMRSVQRIAGVLASQLSARAVDCAPEPPSDADPDGGGWGREAPAVDDWGSSPSKGPIAVDWDSVR